MNKNAFTMAEILLSLTIIGVVAAITLPSLTGNINERTWNTQRKALYARFSQAISLMPSLNGYGTLTENTSGSVTQDTAAETFVTQGLAKVLKINNICENEHLKDCGLPEKIIPLKGSPFDFPKTMKDLNQYLVNNSADEFGYSVFSQINTKAAAFETQNGESIAVYYTPTCMSDTSSTTTYNPMTNVCTNFIYDLNGSKGPNTVGKDIGFITIFYPVDSIIVAPYPYSNNSDSITKKQTQAAAYCTGLNSEYRLPNKYEMASIFVNKYLLGDIKNAIRYNTSSVFSATSAWTQGSQSGYHFNDSKNNANYVYCIKR